jgi:hypothetical protein
VGRIINTGLFDMEKAQESAGWITEVSSLMKPNLLCIIEKWSPIKYNYVPTLS